MSLSKQQKFWNRIAERYAARPLKDVAAYDAMIGDVSSHLKPADHVLELGCGTGGTAIRLAPHVSHWTATDFSAEMIRIARSKPAGDNLTFKVADAENAYDGGPFDVICAFNVLHLVENQPAALAQIFANLKPGGLLISKTWCFADLRFRFRLLFRALQSVGLFPAVKPHSISDLRQSMTDAGFEITDERVFGKHPQNPYIVARKPEPQDLTL
ncbi:class I SAM-dependent methyltransferase [Rhizobium sp. 'Codium 1']|uniref:class I SAM-dependent methyltransferase n=1 Tax=Rhizobium sp. 'Codium 1' TaxID=2940484 RepID=UPI001E326522|nr:class I SAM-dependent methyltransferase [Rhizobium sp. 'Codium 1']MCC8934123.1 class I SAM-dependent methyltransferase [Rhizobium sp. 'Codium 1']